jgi:uncharacterized protein
LQLVSIEASTFHKAALLALNSESKLRSGDSLHLACALQLKADSIASLNVVLSGNAEKHALKLVFPSENS